MTPCRAAVRCLLAVLVCSGLSWILKSQPPGQERQYTIRTTARLVLLDVSVKSATGDLVGGLSKENFEVRENGKLQQITEFAHADMPVTVGLVVDESGSMRHKQPDVITAALVFIGASNPQDEIFVINFNEKARRGLPDIQLFSDNLSQLRDALWRGVPQGRTALYDAVEMALHQLDFGRRDKKTLIVISDGGDNVSATSLPQITREVLETVATIYTIGIYDDDDPDKNPAVLNRIAHISGGGAYFPKTLDEIAPICREIAKDIRSRYTIGYVPPAAEKTSERHVKVSATSADGKRLVVRTRTRYLFTPDNDGQGSR